MFSEVLDLDLAGVVPSMAGPKRPQDRVALPEVWDSFVAAFRDHAEPDPKATEIGRFVAEGGNPRVDRIPGQDDVTEPADGRTTVGHGSVVIAAITSCTNTSNPSVMVAAGLLHARRSTRDSRRSHGSRPRSRPAPRVVTDYLDLAGLTPYLDKLGFAPSGYGCTTCIGNSGPLIDEVARAVDQDDLTSWRC